MSLEAHFQSAGLVRVLIVDDDLSRTVDLASLDRHGQGVVISDILADANHDYTFALDDELERLGLPHVSQDDRLAALKDPEVRALAHEVLRGAYERAMTDREALREPLDKIKEWLTVEGVELEEWTEARALPEADRYDLLVVDYFLMDNDPQATYELIREFKQAHVDRERPLLVILMSSDIGAISGHFEDIRDKCEISVSRFRILAKPVIANPDSDEDVKQKWLRALQQLATERPLVMPIERFVEAWKTSLNKAAKQMVRRLYDLDASAFALLSATANQDSMKLEEYLADVLSRRVSAEAEEHGFPFAEIDALRQALNDAQSTIGPTIDQGVEVRHAQRAIRSLMSDVAWHRRPWWEPAARPPRPADVAPGDPAVAPVDAAPAAGQELPAEVPGEIGKNAPAADAAAPGAAAAPATAPEAPHPAHTEDRLVWMKRYIRFGTILREREGAKRYFVNLTQACDVQSEKLNNLAEVHYLLMRGRKLAVDKVTASEKLFESEYYCEDLESDEFFALQWQLRQPSTPSMASLLEDLEHFEIVGQLRSDAAYAVLAKYVSQASRVARIRTPKIYRYSVEVYRKQTEGWVLQAVEAEASAWQNDRKWRIQFAVTEARKLLPHFNGVNDARRAEIVTELVRGVEVKAGAPLAFKLIRDTVTLVRVDVSTDADVAKLADRFNGDTNYGRAAVGATLIATQIIC
ncbi:hypothetical protein [Xanthomonas phaseoli]|uniref:hypothetical protein n=1 Tax=Xanthomonas phaseoli TaxID=1985254 RepID=UPI001237F904|nr:hypothetical protein [Xanthomonas phaseoli]MBO9832566.1 hypothetical protein [Xanthomonas phaseoli pv. dieffenbachiae]MBO9839423.1 hypothetical protein [Xanthomonas phaseoli pv. dieffenbachiae]MBO9898412.1 hypothetical protein [Xanthomonas phaseoli pv. dieffenbachiae]MBO9901856.1 hypothetical protein [Xanthomonas phaseoli pv. dieffenbachiae]MBO9906619.1 hypothetical protein [Xanthomonas phaseoli pv. dieffenbachiae]